uniref:Uncharacterized protein n=1 Tax=Jaculus jaculus TaxID=51337 RepID=A0A8C5KAY9_JACJA
MTPLYLIFGFWALIGCFSPSESHRGHGRPHHLRPLFPPPLLPLLLPPKHRQSHHQTPASPN